MSFDVSCTGSNSLVSRALRVYLNHSLIAAIQYSASLRIQILSACHSTEISKNWEGIVRSAERITQYIKNCQLDDKYNIFSVLGLVIIDRTEEILKCNIQAIKIRCRSNFDLYSNKAKVLLQTRKCLIYSLVAEQAGFKELSNMWILASQSSFSSSTTFDQLEGCRNKARTTKNKQLRLIYQQTVLYAARNAALDIIIEESDKLDASQRRKYKQLNHAAGNTLSCFYQTAAHTVRSEEKTEFTDWWLQLAKYGTQAAEIYAQVSEDTTEERYIQLLQLAENVKKKSTLLQRILGYIEPFRASVPNMGEYHARTEDPEVLEMHSQALQLAHNAVDYLLLAAQTLLEDDDEHDQPYATDLVSRAINTDYTVQCITRQTESIIKNRQMLKRYQNKATESKPDTEIPAFRSKCRENAIEHTTIAIELTQKAFAESLHCVYENRFSSKRRGEHSAVINAGKEESVALYCAFVADGYFADAESHLMNASVAHKDGNSVLHYLWSHAGQQLQEAGETALNEVLVQNKKVPLLINSSDITVPVGSDTVRELEKAAVCYERIAKLTVRHQQKQSNNDESSDAHDILLQSLSTCCNIRTQKNVECPASVEGIIKIIELQIMYKVFPTHWADILGVSLSLESKQSAVLSACKTSVRWLAAVGSQYYVQALQALCTSEDPQLRELFNSACEQLKTMCEILFKLQQSKSGKMDGQLTICPTRAQYYVLAAGAHAEGQAAVSAFWRQAALAVSSLGASEAIRFSWEAAAHLTTVYQAIAEQLTLQHINDSKSNDSRPLTHTTTLNSNSELGVCASATFEYLRPAPRLQELSVLIAEYSQRSEMHRSEGRLQEAELIESAGQQCVLGICSAIVTVHNPASATLQRSEMEEHAKAAVERFVLAAEVLRARNPELSDCWKRSAELASAAEKCYREASYNTTKPRFGVLEAHEFAVGSQAYVNAAKALGEDDRSFYETWMKAREAVYTVLHRSSKNSGGSGGGIDFGFVHKLLREIKALRIQSESIPCMDACAGTL